MPGRLETLAVAARALGRPLSVVRAMVDGGPRAVVVKAHDPGYADHWRRESAAPALVRGGLPVPELLATVDDPPLVVLADAGSGPTLADALLGDSPPRPPNACTPGPTRSRR